MGRSLSPAVRRELENLGKDTDSQKSAMKALKNYVKDLDTKDIPLFLAQVPETKEPSTSSGDCTISLYEVLARFHGRNIVPQIDNIMFTLVKTLSSSAGSFPLHQACSKVVPAIARYSIDPATKGIEKTSIICSLCRPLLDILMAPQEGSSSGAALCLKALVECDNWRFASDDVVNELCMKVACALQEKVTQTTSHLCLVMALSKHNRLMMEPYARSLVQSGLQILNADCKVRNSQKRLLVIQMIHFLIKNVDARSFSSELANVVNVMEKCQSDPMPFVRSAASETLQMAKVIAGQRGPRHERRLSSVAGSTFRSKNDRMVYQVQNNNIYAKFKDSDAECKTPESQNVASFVDFDTSIDSPISAGECSCNMRYDMQYCNRELGNNDAFEETTPADMVSSKGSSRGDSSEVCVREHRDVHANVTDYENSNQISGFIPCAGWVTLDTAISPQRSKSQLTIDDVKIYTTPRKLVSSLQDLPASPCAIKNQNAEFRSRIVGKCDCNKTDRTNGDVNSLMFSYEKRGRKMQDTWSLSTEEHGIQQAEKRLSSSTESILSTCQAYALRVCTPQSDYSSENAKGSTERRANKGSSYRVISAILLVLLTVFLSSTCRENRDFNVAPT